jgi:hypothetical protein
MKTNEIVGKKNCLICRQLYEPEDVLQMVERYRLGRTTVYDDARPGSSSTAICVKEEINQRFRDNKVEL